MDGEEPSVFPDACREQVAADAVMTDSARASSSVVYFGSAERISEGFALALRAMGAGAGILPVDPALPDASSNLEDS